MAEEKDLDTMILEEIENDFKTVRRICEDLQVRGIQVDALRIDTRMKSFRKFKMVEFKMLDFPVRGPKPLAYKKA